MDREKLHKAAQESRIATANEAFGYSDSFDIIPSDICIDELMESSYVEGAEWLMKQPLSERLTEEEKQRISVFLDDASHTAIDAIDAVEFIESIFGTDLFTNKSEKK